MHKFIVDVVALDRAGKMEACILARDRILWVVVREAAANRFHGYWSSDRIDSACLTDVCRGLTNKLKMITEWDHPGHGLRYWPEGWKYWGCDQAPAELTDYLAGQTFAEEYALVTGRRPPRGGGGESG